MVATALAQTLLTGTESEYALSQTPDHDQRQQDEVSDGPVDLKVPVYGLFLLGVLYTLYLAHEILFPILLAVLTALALAPMVRWAGRRLRIPRPISALMAVLALLAAMIGLAWAVVMPMLDWAERAPHGVSQLLLGQSELTSQLDRLSQSAREIEEQIEALGEDNGPDAVVVQTSNWREDLASGAQRTVAAIALALTLTYFLLVGGDRLIQNLVRQLPRRHRRTVLRVIKGSQQQIASYLAVVCSSNALVGVAIGLVAWAAGLPTPAVWGLIAGLTRFIPYLGVIIALLLLTVVSAYTHDEIWMIALVPASYLLLSALVGVFVEPWIHGYRMAINPVVIFVAIFFWGWLWGPVGALLAVPLMTVIQVVLRQIEPLRPVYRVIAR